MHESSYRHMSRLVDGYLDRQQHLTIVDVGSYDVNGSYRALFDHPAWRYIGVDLAPGPNVDVVLRSPDRLPFADFSVDVVVSGQAFEHMASFWIMWLEIVQVLRPQGLIFLIAPSRGPEHRYPLDCWRFYPDGFRALAQYGGLEVAELHTDWDPDPDPGSAVWGDTVGVFRKPPMGVRARLRSRLVHRVRRLAHRCTGAAIGPVSPGVKEG